MVTTITAGAGGSRHHHHGWWGHNRSAMVRALVAIAVSHWAARVAVTTHHRGQEVVRMGGASELEGG